MNAVYPSALAALMSGEVDWTSGSFFLHAMSGYDYDPTDDSVLDIPLPHWVVDAPITGRTVSAAGEAYADDATIVSPPAGRTIDSFVVVEVTDTQYRLIAYIDQLSTDVPLSIQTADADINVKWATYVFK